mmetsp:Transcript_737/g.2243  ORF Transcript_737/g.2243 Transcript_737/m.2243 type:complete len:224 (-) Transcript_737:191-862(-)
MSGAGMLADERGPDGIPYKSDYDRMAPEPKSLFKVYSIVFVLPTLIGTAVAVPILLFYPRKAYKSINVLADFELGPVYLVIWVLKYFILLINANLGTARRRTKVNVPDQHVYQVYGGPAAGSFVMMADDGDMGKFNRAQRALQNLMEQLPMLLVELLLVGFVFPWEVMAIAILWGMARLKGATGYTEDRKARMKGNMASMVLGGVLDGMLVVSGVEAVRLAFQ